MTTSGSRRAPHDPGAARPSRVPAVLLVLLVVATGAGLAVAGAATTPAVVRHEAELTAKPDQRQVVCPASDVDSTSVVGLLPGVDQGTVSADGTPLDIPVAGTTTVKGPGRDPLTVTATGEATRGVYATRAKNVGGGMTACSSPRASWWFVGAGASPGHFSRLELFNPRSGPAIVDVAVLGPDGAVESPGLRGITIPSGSNRSLKLSEVAPSQGNLSIHVQASRGLVEAALDDHVLDVLDPAAKPIAEWIPDASGPTRHVVLSGLPKPGALKSGNGPSSAGATNAQDTLVLANPGNREAVAKIRLSTKDGAFTPKGLQPATVPPESVVAIPLGDFVTNANTAVLVDADQPIVAGYVVPGRTDLVHAVPAEPWTGPAATALPLRRWPAHAPAHRGRRGDDGDGHPVRQQGQGARPGGDGGARPEHGRRAAGPEGVLGRGDLGRGQGVRLGAGQPRRPAVGPAADARARGAAGARSPTRRLAQSSAG